MSRQRNCSVKLVLAALALCSVFALSTLLAEQTVENADYMPITAASPRLGPIVVVEVTLPSRDALDELVRAEYDISNVRGNVVTIYASLEELEQLRLTGYPLCELEPRIPRLEIMGVGGYHIVIGWLSVTRSLPHTIR